MRFQVRHLLFAMAATALAVQWSILQLSHHAFRGDLRGGSDWSPWRWLVCTIVIVAIFVERPRKAVRVLALLFLAGGLYLDRGPFTTLGWISIVLAVASAVWLLMPLVSRRFKADAVLAVMVPTTLALVMVLTMDVLARPYLSDAMHFRLERLQYALDKYRAKHGHYPPPYLRNTAGQRTQSWRALLVPYLPSVTLHDPLRGYKIDKPWNHEGNEWLAHVTPLEYSPVIGNRWNEGQCDCFAPMGPLRDSRTTQRVVQQPPTIDYVHRLMIGSAIVPHWNEPVDCEFYADGGVVIPGMDWLGAQREHTIVQLQLHDPPDDPLLDPLKLTATSSPPAPTTSLDERITIFDCPRMVRYWGGSAAFKPPRPAYAIFWVGLASYVLLDVLISFALAGAARRRDAIPLQVNWGSAPPDGFVAFDDEPLLEPSGWSTSA